MVHIVHVFVVFPQFGLMLKPCVSSNSNIIECPTFFDGSSEDPLDLQDQRYAIRKLFKVSVYM